MDPVIIAGAGPVGLALALALAHNDVPSIVLDEAEGPITDGEALLRPKTVVLGPETTALLERLGHPGIHRDGAAWAAWRVVRRRQEVLRIDFGPDSGPSPVHLHQQRLEQSLRSALHGHGLVRIVHGSRVDALEQDASGVTVHTRGAQQTWWRGSYLVGCDGPRSTIRKLLGIRFPGRTAVDRHAVATLSTDLPEPGVALLHRDPPGSGTGPEVTARPLPDGVWRIDWLLRQREELLTSDALVTRIRATLTALCGSVVPYELVGSAEYPVHQRLARRWRTGRAFLAGDAAHLMGALGAQSVEEGLRDAENLAWKLALTWHGGAGDALLDSYQAERRDAVGARLRATDQALPLLRANGAWTAVRHMLLSGSARGHAELLTENHLGRGPMAGPPVYSRTQLAPPVPRPGARPSGSALVATCATPPGGQIIDVPVTALDGARAQLVDRLGRGLLVVLIAPGTGVWDSRHWLTAGLMPRLASAVSALPMSAELLVAESYPDSTAHTVLLVRPDGHLVAAMVGCRPAELYSLADLVRGGPPRHDAADARDTATAGERVSGRIP